MTSEDRCWPTHGVPSAQQHREHPYGSLTEVEERIALLEADAAAPRISKREQRRQQREINGYIPTSFVGQVQIGCTLVAIVTAFVLAGIYGEKRSDRIEREKWDTFVTDCEQAKAVVVRYDGEGVCVLNGQVELDREVRP